MLRARTAITGIAALILGMASPLALALPANAAASGNLTTVINVHYAACLSQFSDPGSLVGIDLKDQPFCGFISSGDFSTAPTSNHLQNWTVSTHADNGAIVTCTTSAGTTIDCFELVNYHSNLCLTEDGLTVGVDKCNGSNGDDLWTAIVDPTGPVNGLLIFHLKNIHYGYCLWTPSTGLGGTEMNTCPSASNGDHTYSWYIPNL